MNRKPKTHPTYGTQLSGINFRERWNIVSCASEQELEAYIDNYRQIEKEKRNPDKSWWERKYSTVNEQTQNNYFRKLWRKRYSESFEKDVLYRIDKTIGRWDMKLAPPQGDGIGTSWALDRDRVQVLEKNDILMLTKVDEMGNLYFAKANDVDAKYPYVFNRDNSQIGFIVPLDT